MRILVACEVSQAVTIQLRKLGHEAYSCDIKPCTGGHPEWHIQGDVLKQLRKKWDMMIAFPPCTHLANSGAAFFEEKRKDGRQQEAIDFFMKLVNAPIPKIAIENPVGIMSSEYRKPDQIIQPWQFGDPYQKSTCLWLKNLPPLNHTRLVNRGEFYYWVDQEGKTRKQPLWYVQAKSQGKTQADVATIRSKTFPGIAKAMAVQWTAKPKKKTVRKPTTQRNRIKNLKAA